MFSFRWEGAKASLWPCERDSRVHALLCHGENSKKKKTLPPLYCMCTSRHPSNARSLLPQTRTSPYKRNLTQSQSPVTVACGCNWSYFQSKIWWRVWGRDSWRLVFYVERAPALSRASTWTCPRKRRAPRLHNEVRTGPGQKCSRQKGPCLAVVG